MMATPMSVVPGSKTSIVFYTFTGQYQPLYYGAGKGTLNLASVNAGNSNGLCVGLGGVNGGFFTALTKAGQTNANLSSDAVVNGQKGCATLPVSTDDYQGRHQNLLAKAGATGTAFEAYKNTDPCAFSFVNGAQVNYASGWYEGVCFVDVFDGKLCPDGDTKNAAMLYIAPPYGANYTQKSDFLAAIQATAVNMVKTIAGYNAIAAQNGQPLIEAVRNTLYSSNNYKMAGVSNDEIARAIFSGFTSELNATPTSGLIELQFPVNPGGTPLFDAVQADLGAAPHQAHPAGGQPHKPIKVHKPTLIEGGEDDDNDSDDDDDNDDDDKLDQVGKRTDPTKLRADAMPIAQTSATVQKAAAADLAALQAKKAPVNYGNLPPRANAHYEAANAPMTEPSRGRVVERVNNIYGQVSAADYNNIDAPKHPNDSAALGHAKDAKAHSDAVTHAANDVLTAPDLKTAAAARDMGRSEAKRARAAADAARKIATQLDPRDVFSDPDDVQLKSQEAMEAGRFADAADVVASGAERLVESIDAHVDDLKRYEAKLRSPRNRVIGIVLAVIGLVATVGGLIWTFLFGYARGSASGAFRFDAQDINVSGSATDATIVVDVMAELAKVNGGSVLEFIAAVKLVDSSGNRQDTINNANGTPLWNVTNLTIVYTPPAGTRSAASVQYELQAAGPVAPAYTDAKKLSISFSSVVVPPPDPVNPVDIIVAAADRINTVKITVPNGFQTSATDSEGAWSYDKANNAASFTPNAGATVSGNLKVASYTLTNGGKTANLVILFPAPVLSHLGDRLIAFSFDAVATFANNVRAMLTFGTTAALVTTANATSTLNGAQVIVGTWSLTGMDLAQIKFTPNGNLTDSVLSVDAVPFALVYGGVVSNAGSATVTLPAPSTGMVPVAKDLSKVTADRTSVVTFDLIGAKLTGTSNSTGTWAVDKANNQIKFSPASLPAAQTNVSVTYVLTNAVGDSKPASLSITFLPEPLDIHADNIARTANYTFDIGATNPGITADYVLKLWDGTKAVATLPDAATGGSWTAGVRSIVYGLPSGPLDPALPLGSSGPIPLKSDSASVQYVFAAVDGTTDAPAKAVLNFDKTKPVAYPFGITVKSLSPKPTTQFIAHCYFPTGYSAVYLGPNPAAKLTQITENEAGVNVGVWNVVPPPDDNPSAPPTISFAPSGAGGSSFTMAYSVVDKNGNVSNTANITFTLNAMSMVRMRNFLLADDATAGKAAAADVLANASSLFSIDPKSLKLVGLNDINNTGLPPDALVKNDGKALSVPGEGVWMVTDDAKIAFQSESGLTTPPTPAMVQVADVSGNISNLANILIDPGLSQLSTLGTTFALDDAAFWSAFRKHVAVASPPLTPEEFISATSVFSGVTRLALANTGADPVSYADFNAAFATWDAAGQPWDPANGDGTNDLVALCSAAVTASAPALMTSAQARYWQLEMVARMLAHALPDDSTAQGAKP